MAADRMGGSHGRRATSEGAPASTVPGRAAGARPAAGRPGRSGPPRAERMRDRPRGRPSTRDVVVRVGEGAAVVEVGDLRGCRAPLDVRDAAVAARRTPCCSCWPDRGAAPSRRPRRATVRRQLLPDHEQARHADTVVVRRQLVARQREPGVVPADADPRPDAEAQQRPARPETCHSIATISRSDSAPRSFVWATHRCPSVVNGGPTTRSEQRPCTGSAVPACDGRTPRSPRPKSRTARARRRRRPPPRRRSPRPATRWTTASRRDGAPRAQLLVAGPADRQVGVEGDGRPTTGRRRGTDRPPDLAVAAVDAEEGDRRDHARSSRVRCRRGRAAGAAAAACP